MDSGFLARIVIALLIAAALFVQARRLIGQPHRRRAFVLGAVALLCFALFNLFVSQGGAMSGLLQLFALAGVGLFLAAAVSLVLSLRSGERASDQARIAEEARAYHENRKSD